MIDFEKIGFVPDSEFKGVFNHPNAPICVWMEENNDIAISWDMEYTIRYTASEERLIALFNAFKE